MPVHLRELFCCTWRSIPLIKIKILYWAVKFLEKSFRLIYSINFRETVPQCVKSQPLPYRRYGTYLPTQLLVFGFPSKVLEHRRFCMPSPCCFIIKFFYILLLDTCKYDLSWFVMHINSINTDTVIVVRCFEATRAGEHNCCNQTRMSSIGTLA